MRIALACASLLIALGLLGFITLGWGSTILEQGLEAALTDLTTQPSLPMTVTCLVLGTVFLFVGVRLLGQPKGD